MDFDAGGVGGLDEGVERIEGGGEGGEVREGFEGVEEPGVAAAADLDEEGVGAGGFGAGDYFFDVGEGVEVGVEGVGPEGAVFGAGGGEEG